jgi:circadian clock protein KaiC
MSELLKKAPTGIAGLDELTEGGLPAGRSTLVCGGPGCGKTLLAATFLVSGAVDHNEPGVFLSFDERVADLGVNTASLGFDLPRLQERGLVAADHVYIERENIEETGEYDLEGLFVRLDHAIRRVGARRVVLDSIDTLFAGIPNLAIVRSELRRLLGWLKERGLSTMITAERGEQTLTRHGVEEYVSDCVILLDHRVIDEISTRRLRVVKYRGAAHGTNEYPFLIDRDGIMVFPVTSLALAHQVSSERVPSGLSGLDAMLDGKGYFKGSSVLLGGGPGTGKTSIAAHLAEATCRAGQRAAYFAFEESPDQLIRNMQSIGIDLRPWIDKNLLRIQASRPTLHGLEMHLALLLKTVQDFQPDVVIVDPLSALVANSSPTQTENMILRLVDHLKMLGITAFYTGLHVADGESGLNVSSIMDTWIIVRNTRLDDDLVRRLHVVKSRGMPHSARVLEMEITPAGVRLHDLDRAGVERLAARAGRPTPT